MSSPTTTAGVLEAFVLFVRYIRALWPFRKLYIEAPAFNVAQYRSAVDSGFLKEEARLVEHTYFDGRYWDFYIYSIDEALAANLAARLAREP